MSKSLIRSCLVLSALGVAFGSSALYSTYGWAKDQKEPNKAHSSKRMQDGKEWMTENLNVAIARSYCYEVSEMNCHRYGRLYTWESAKEGCQSLGNGWRLPTNDEWQKMAKHYGGVRGDSDDDGKSAYKELMVGGGAGFNVQFGGRHSPENGEYARLDAHGFYWTATETNPTNAWFYNFGQARFLNRHSDGEKKMALSVRCVRD
jgi:uncharacterized protein (TIGR02145 family)